MSPVWQILYVCPLCVLSLCDVMRDQSLQRTLSLFQLNMMLGLAGTYLTDMKNSRENMQACRKTQTSPTSITDAVCCPLTPFNQSHTASPKPHTVQHFLKLVTSVKGAIKHPPLFAKICYFITTMCQAQPRPMEVISVRSLPDSRNKTTGT